VSTTPAINDKKFETESFSIFCLETIGLQYTLIEWIFPKCSFKGVHCTVGRLIYSIS